jgi:diguanylate cyclase (GGDEF)-like protein
MMGALYSIVTPGGLILLAAVACAEWLELPDSTSPIHRYAPSAILAVGLIVGGRFHRSQFALGCMVLALVDWALILFASPSASAAPMEQIAFRMIAVLLPLNLLILSLAEDRGLLSKSGVFRLLFVLCQPALIAFVCVRWPGPAASTLGHELVGGLFTELSPVPQIAWLVFGLAFGLLALQFFMDRNDVAGGFFWALTAILISLHGDPTGVEARLYTATAGIILVTAQIESIYHLAFRDELTELPSRRALNQAILDLEDRYTVAMVDIDHFKHFNDNHGHEIGDQVLRMVAFKLARVTGGGRAYRYGGEEFVILFRGKQADEVRPHLEGLCMLIEAHPFVIRSPGLRDPDNRAVKSAKPNKRASITISIGVAESQGPRANPNDVIRAADDALYRAKDGGRNQVCT